MREYIENFLLAALDWLYKLLESIELIIKSKVQIHLISFYNLAFAIGILIYKFFFLFLHNETSIKKFLILKSLL